MKKISVSLFFNRVLDSVRAAFSVGAIATVLVLPTSFSGGTALGATIYYMNGTSVYSDAGGTTSVTVPTAMTDDMTFKLVTGATTGTFGTKITSGAKKLTFEGGTFKINSSGGFFFEKASEVRFTNTTVTTNNVGEILGNTKFVFDNSTFTNNIYTANSLGLFLSNSSKVYLGGSHAYGALLINGGGGINATAGENWLYICENVSNPSTLGYISLRSTENPAMTVSANATLHYVGHLRSTRSGMNNANLYKKGDGLLSIEKGNVGASQSGSEKNWIAGIFNAQGGTTKLTDGASWYGATTVNVSNGATVQLDSAALAASTTTYSIAGKGFNEQGALNVTKNATSGVLTMTADSAVGVGTGATFTPAGVAGNFQLTKVGDGTLNFKTANATSGDLVVAEGIVSVTDIGTLKANSTVTVAEGATLLFSSSSNGLDHLTTANFVVNGTLRLATLRNTSSNVSNVRGTITASGANALVDLALNDTLGYFSSLENTISKITLADGATMTNSIVRTATTKTAIDGNDSSCQITIGSELELNGGRITSYSVGRQHANYGNYLVNSKVQVTGNTVSTVDAYGFQIRNNGGTWTIEDGATLEICSVVASNGPNMTLKGGGTFRPIVQTRMLQTCNSTTMEAVTQSFQILNGKNLICENVTLDLTALDTIIDRTQATPTTSAVQVSGTDPWQLVTTSSATKRNGAILVPGKFVAGPETRIEVNVTLKDGVLVGQTIQASSIDQIMNNVTLDLVLDEDVDWIENSNSLEAYELFLEEYGTLKALNVIGGHGVLVSLVGNSLNVEVLPEPSTWAMILTGLAFGGFFLCRKQTKLEVSQL